MSFNCSYPYNPNVTCFLQPAVYNNTAYALMYDADMAQAGQCLLQYDIVFTECVTKSKERRAALGLPSGSHARPTLGRLPLLLLLFLVFLSAACAKAVSCSRFDPDSRDAWDWNAVTPSIRLEDAASLCFANAPCGGPFKETATTSLTWAVNGTVEVKVKPADVVALVGGSYATKVTSVPADGMWINHGRAYMTTFAYAVNVSGWFEQCSDGQRYRGSALVPDGDRVALRYFYTDQAGSGA
ncbi:uncharacterized protein LOC62_02G002242 [Vanrija pseudolonga]|uniref:Uncharacterized protein n=1 Tax=Vanrija pseudolonga TaxID=143232 RepID=A0AAF1BGG3_9TREE|nr:hypothetical protein LOC62_02G002242 [Vanrija pseudolonga]